MEGNKSSSSLSDHDSLDNPVASGEVTFMVNEAKFHPISCRHCKKLHKVCSKELPACSGCQWRGVECVYDTPQKKGRVSKRKEFEKKRSQSSGKIVSSSPSNHDELAEYIYHGIRIRILSELNRGKDMIEDSAMKITMKTESDYFIFCPSFIVTPITVACKVHLHIAKSIELGERKNCDANSPLGPVDYFQVLAKDLRAIKTMAKRFKKVNLVHASMMREMEAIIERKQFYNALSELISKTNTSEISSNNHDFTEFENMTTTKDFFQFITNGNTQNGTSSTNINTEQKKKEYEQNVNSFLTNFNNVAHPTMEGANADPFEGYINCEEIHQLFNIRYDSPISFLPDQ